MMTPGNPRTRGEGRGRAVRGFLSPYPSTPPITEAALCAAIFTPPHPSRRTALYAISGFLWGAEARAQVEIVSTCGRARRGSHNPLYGTASRRDQKR